MHCEHWVAYGWHSTSHTADLNNENYNSCNTNHYHSRNCFHTNSDPLLSHAIFTSQILFSFQMFSGWRSTIIRFDSPSAEWKTRGIEIKHDSEFENTTSRAHSLLRSWPKLKRLVLILGQGFRTLLLMNVTTSSKNQVIKNGLDPQEVRSTYYLWKEPYRVSQSMDKTLLKVVLGITTSFYMGV